MKLFHCNYGGYLVMHFMCSLYVVGYSLGHFICCCMQSSRNRCWWLWKHCR